MPGESTDGFTVPASRPGASNDTARRLIQNQFQSLKKQYEDAMTHRLTRAKGEKLLAKMKALLRNTKRELLRTSEGDDLQTEIISYLEKSTRVSDDTRNAMRPSALLHRAKQAIRDLERYRDFGALTLVQKQEILLAEIAAEMEEFRYTDERFAIFLDRVLPEARRGRTRTTSEAIASARAGSSRRSGRSSALSLARASSADTDAMSLVSKLEQERTELYRKEWSKWLELAEDSNSQPTRVDTDSNSQAVIAGNIFASLREPSTTVRIFTSSTFTDTELERNELMEYIYPFLKDLCTKVGYAFQVVDMRWGVRSQTSNDHGTGELCISEVEKCLSMSVGPAFITFLGEKYGYCPFPRRIPADEFEKILDYLRNVHKLDTFLLSTWFKKDRNAIPHEFILQPISTHIPDFTSEDPDLQQAASSEWWRIFSQLQNMLRQGSRCLEDPELEAKYFYSVTEEEVIHGLLSNQRRHTQAFAFLRDIDDVDVDDGEARKYVDITVSPVGDNVRDPKAKEALKKMKHDVTVRLNSDNIFTFDLPWAEGGFSLDDPQYSKYLARYCKTVGVALAKAILKARSEHKVVGDALASEIHRHTTMLRSLAKEYTARGPLSRPLMEYLTRTHNGGAYIIHGAPGTGKTSLLCGILSQYARENKNAVIIPRFIGTSPESGSCRGVLKSVIQQIYRAYGRKPYIAGPDILQLVSDFATALEFSTPLRPLVVALDGLEDISSLDRGKEYFWLPNVIPTSTRLVLTTHSKAGPMEIIETVRSQVSSHSAFQILPALSQTDAESMLEKWSSLERRTITTSQRDQILNCMYTTPTPLYLSLACEMARSWHSYQETIQLEDTVSGLINQMLSNLEGRHGKLLVTRALSYITVAKDGLSDLELEDVLSLDDDVLDNVYEWWTPPVRRIPSMLWIRIRSELGNYLSERGQHKVLAWSYGPWKEAILDRYLKIDREKKARHEALVEYFDSRWSENPKPYLDADQETLAHRFVAAQPLLHDGQKVNVRRIAELPHSLEHAGKMMALRECISDLKMFSVLYQSEEFKFELLRFWRLVEPKDPYLTATEVYEEAALAQALSAQTDVEKGHSIDLLVLVGRFAIDVAQYDCAEIMLSTALKQEESQKNGDFSEVDPYNLHILLGLAQMQLGRYQPAHVSYIQARFLAKQEVVNVTGALIGTGDVHFKQGALEEALNSYKEAESILKPFLTKASVGGHVDADMGRAVSLHAELYGKTGKVLRWMSKFDDARHYTEECVSISERAFGKQHIKYAQALHALAELLRQLGQFVESEPLYLSAVNISQKLLGKNHPDYAELLNGLAGAYRELGRYSDALPLYKDILRIREASFDANHPDVAYAYNNLGVIYSRMSKFDEAIPLLKRAVDIRQSIFGEDNINTVWSLYQLAKATRLLGHPDEALPMYQNVLKVREEKLGADNESVAEALNGLAGCMRDLARWDEMAQAYERALAIREQCFGSEHPDVAYSCGSLGEAYATLGRLKEAEPLLQRAVDLRIKLLGEEHPHTAWSIFALAKFQRDTGRLKEARESFQRCYDIRSQVLGHDHAHTSQSLFGLADTLSQLGETEAAIPLYEDGLSINRKIYADQHPAVADGMDRLGVAYQKVSNMGEARSYLQQALKMRQDLLDDDHPDLAVSYHHYGRFLKQVGDLAGAESNARKALDIREQSLGAAHALVAESLDAIASILRDRDHKDDAVVMYEKALAIREKLYGKIHQDVAYSHGNLARMYYEIGDYNLAMTEVQYSMDIRKELVGEEHPDYAWSLAWKGKCAKAKGDLDMAEESFREALGIRLNTYGECHVTVSESLNMLAGLLRDRERYDAAKHSYLRSLEILEHLYSPTHSDISFTLTNLAEVECKLGNFGAAEIMLDRAVEQRLSREGPEHSHTAWTKMILMELYLMTKRVDKANSMLPQLLEIFKKAYGEESLQVARLYHSEGLGMRKSGDAGQARHSFTRELDILQKHLPASHQRIQHAKAALETAQ